MALFVASLLALVVFLVVIGYLAFGSPGTVLGLSCGALVAGLLFACWLFSKRPGGGPNA